MKSLPQILMSVLLLSSSAAFAQSRIQDYLVYASEGIDAHSSDYQGRTGSGGPIRLVDFMVNLPRSQAQVSNRALLSSTSVSFTRGSVRRDRVTAMDAQGLATVTAPSVRLSKVAHAATEKKGVARLDTQMERLADSLRRDLPRYASVTQVDVPRFVGAGGLGVNYFEIDAARLDGARFISFEGNDRELFVVHVTGYGAVNWIGTHFALSPGLRPSQILFFFDGIDALTIRDSGSDAWTGLGIPVNILAPQTTLTFNRALITGSVWVRRIQSLGMEGALSGPGGGNGLPSGQINDGCFPWERVVFSCDCAR